MSTNSTVAPSAGQVSHIADMRHDISFKTHDRYTLRGWAYPPLDNSTRPPIVILSNGLAGSKEHYLDDFAAYYQKAGFGCLAFDHLNWGASDSPFPRFSDPVYQVSEYVSAVFFVQNTCIMTKHSLRSCMVGCLKALHQAVAAFPEAHSEKAAMRSVQQQGAACLPESA